MFDQGDLDSQKFHSVNFLCTCIECTLVSKHLLRWKKEFVSFSKSKTGDAHATGYELVLFEIEMNYIKLRKN